MEMSEELYPRTPNFSHPSHGFHHTVDSALDILFGLGVSPSRISIRMAGRGWPSYWVVDQVPPAGTALGPDVNVSLSVAGLGFFHALPVGMWDKGGEAELGTQEIVELFDDPIQKAAHWIREGARLFDIGLDNYPACSRWISLFGLNPDDWPTENWYNLALLLPTLQRLAGKEEGIRFALQLLFDLPLKELRRSPAYSYMDDEHLTLLARKASRLGVDCIVGDRVENVARLTVVIGPVPLNTYYNFREPENQRRLDSLLSLCMTCYQGYRISWLVLYPERAPHLGYEHENARLGINSHLGRDIGSRSQPFAVVEA